MLTEPLEKLDSFRKLEEAVKQKQSPVMVNGVIDVQRLHLISAIRQKTQRPIIVFTHNELRAKEMMQDYGFFDSNRVLYPAIDMVFYHADVHSTEVERQRFGVRSQLLAGEHPVIFASMEAICPKMVPKERFQKGILQLHVGDVIEMDDLCHQLVLMGYERAELVEGRGQFARRGGILDLFSPTEEEAVRIEFWDDEIDSIRQMDTANQRSVEKLEETTIFPMRDLVCTQQEAKDAAKKMIQELDQVQAQLHKQGAEEVCAKLDEHIREAAERLQTEFTCSNADRFLAYFCSQPEGFWQYLPEDCIVVMDEPERIREHMQTVWEEYSRSLQGRLEGGYLLPKESENMWNYDELLLKLAKFDTILLSGLMRGSSDFKIQTAVDFSVRSTPVFRNREDLFLEEMERKKKEKACVLLLCTSSLRGKRLADELTEKGIPAAYSEEDTPLVPGTVRILRGSLSGGFCYDYIGLSIYAENDLFGDQKRKKKKKKKKQGQAIQSFTDLKVGDYVVHDNHGIGQFCGLEKISIEGVQKDYMKISYRDGGNLFVPVSQMEMVQKYIGSGGAAPRLNKLGGQDWAKAKTKAKGAVKEMAEELVALYAKRNAAQGFAYSKDNLWQREFEESFPFEETEDQLNAIADVKQDMESGKVMDRLICGDVGYGKTEVAIRAAFKAVQDGKQVAFLVPTTILAQQHYNTFNQRMSEYPIRVDLLSRFRTTAQQRKTLKDLENGFVDIVIGTHRLLSKDVKFKNLGLIIVDEEQRFGVSHKEKLKKLRENVDVLTLSATPIPRTLHMSLSGIRDMSLLEEPPQERQPIRTYVMENDDEFVKEAIYRELSRGGQVYYLYNRVEFISQEASRLEKMVPEANIAYAHGKMTERELEQIMEDFISGEIDVLVCTTIIETGLDIPNVNTIIIQDADRMGLSQLYQLRGRVGRSTRSSYAYLLYRRDKMLKETAEKRLQTIREFTEFGSGFKIALRDLEIRGAGNLLGAQQHGHMEAVGYDMYCRLLEEAVLEEKGETVEKPFETSLDLQVSAYLPDFYIRNEEQRMEMYQKISRVTSEEDYYGVQEELEDRYGDLPKSAQKLLEVVLLKAAAHKLGVTQIQQKSGKLLIYFLEDAPLDTAKLAQLVTQEKGKYFFTAGANPYLTVKLKEAEEKEITTFLRKLIGMLSDTESGKDEEIQ